MSLLSNIRYSINRRLKFLHEMKVWKEHGDETRYHFNNPDIEIGDFTYGIPDIFVYDHGVKIKIGKYCSIAKDVKILLGGNHPIVTASQFPFHKRKDIFTNASNIEIDRTSDIQIGNDVWLGRGAIVLAGVTIGDGAIIGAGAVVSKDIPPYSIAVGCPIRIVRKRMTDEQIEKMLQLKWWDLSSEEINNLIPFIPDINLFISECSKIRGVISFPDFYKCISTNNLINHIIYRIA